MLRIESWRPTNNEPHSKERFQLNWLWIAWKWATQWNQHHKFAVLLWWNFFIDEKSRQNLASAFWSQIMQNDVSILIMVSSVQKTGFLENDLQTRFHLILASKSVSYLKAKWIAFPTKRYRLLIIMKRSIFVTHSITFSQKYLTAFRTKHIP